MTSYVSQYVHELLVYLHTDLSQLVRICDAHNSISRGWIGIIIILQPNANEITQIMNMFNQAKYIHDFIESAQRVKTLGCIRRRLLRWLRKENVH